MAASGSIPPIDPSKMAIVAELEIEMMSDMYNRMTASCHKKCIPPKYREAELSKGESVCIDRCVAKYLDIHERIGKKLTTISMQDEEAAKKFQEQLQQQQQKN
ncbi:Tim10/DDP family zinc finger protein-like protein [Dinothrombium tinctorium]|uniref:Mitochondrial import inner membrane translocase subunit n=1 Tax=Dinothrombium tinctorium TaxID=1965070 RepID=A0A3S3NJ03_9ACAR|nr:Tim10/DDP family zinc finger protein-like protein [Dinothrombium tinctorium]RWS00376.1 Tim10/DDP family zinc finger protein-like protein [Dinothrombium tinctorium]